MGFVSVVEAFRHWASLRCAVGDPIFALKDWVEGCEAHLIRIKRGEGTLTLIAKDEEQL